MPHAPTSGRHPFPVSDACIDSPMHAFDESMPTQTPDRGSRSAPTDLSESTVYIPVKD